MRLHVHRLGSSSSARCPHLICDLTAAWALMMPVPSLICQCQPAALRCQAANHPLIILEAHQCTPLTAINTI